MYLQMIRKVVGTALCVEGISVLPSVALSLWDWDMPSLRAFLGTGLLCLLVGGLLYAIRLDGRKMQQRDGFAAVALCWLAMTLFGALPYRWSGVLPCFADAFFESASGFSTTGASVFACVETLPRSILLWRAQSQWMGGIGVLVLMLAILPKLGKGGFNLMRAESPGPIKNKILPKAQEMASLLYQIYLILTGAEILLLLLLGLPLFDSVTLSFATISTGGFTVLDGSIAGYGSPALEWVLLVFMFLSGVHFALFFSLLRGQWRSVLRSEELWVYAGLVLGLTLLLCGDQFLAIGRSFSESLRPVLFHVVAILTTTGFVTEDFRQWPGLCRMLFLLMLMLGANAGSTAGGLKTSRLIILLKNSRRELRRIVNPRQVRFVHLDGVRLEEQAVSGVGQFLFLYLLCVSGIAMVLSLEPIDTYTAFTMALSSVSNVGLAGEAVLYGSLSSLSKLVLSWGMLLGRLELLPMLLLCLPTLWRK